MAHCGRDDRGEEKADHLTEVCQIFRDSIWYRRSKTGLRKNAKDTYRERLKTKLEQKTGAELTRNATQWVLENQ